MIAALVLYGSRARGDYRPKSDVDLLAVTDDGPIKNERLAGGVSVYSYPAQLLAKRATAGDLFVLHLLKEGCVLQDSLGVFKSTTQSFKYKDSYIDEITDAYCVWRFIFERKRLLTRKSVRKRLVWVVRTLVIARSAEDRKPVFSSTDIARYAGISELKEVIDHRNQKDAATLDRVVRRVIRKFAEDRVELDWPDNKAAQRDLMRKRGGVPADTLKFVQPRTLIKGRPSAAKPAAARISTSYLDDNDAPPKRRRRTT